MTSRSRPLHVGLAGIGVLGPGLAGWASAAPLLRTPADWVSSPTVVPAPSVLPPNERRRAGVAVKAALAVADEACAMAGVAASNVATVFTSATGDPAVCHAICEALAQPARAVSPTRFTNSVHNAAAGYWHIAVQSRRASTSLAAHDASAAAGLLEAAAQCCATHAPVLLVACDTPYPEPIHSLRPLPDVFAFALLLVPAGTEAPWLLDVAPASVHSTAKPDAASAARCSGEGLEALRRAIPAARALPLLQALASNSDAALTLEADGLDLGLQLRASRMPTTLDRAGIAARIPHRGAMCLLDAMESCSADEIVCRIVNHADAAHPLRLDGVLPAASALEYAAQAMALHGGLSAERNARAGDAPRAGFLASARDVRLHAARLDTAPGPLRVRVQRLAGDSGPAMYRFELHDAHDALLAEGRCTVVLDKPLAAPAQEVIA